MPYICGFNPCVWNSIFGLGKKAAGRQVLCTHRRVTPALGARLLRSYVPLRYGPSESGCVNNTCLPADTLSVREIEISLPRLEEYVIAYYDAVPVGIWCIQEVVAVGHGGKSCAVNSVFCNP